MPGAITPGMERKNCMFQAMFKMGMAGMLSFTSLFLWPLSGSPPASVQIDSQGEGITTLVQQDRKYECKDESRQVVLDLDKPVKVYLAADEQAHIASLQIAGQEVKEAAGLERYEKELEFQEDLSIQAVFEKSEKQPGKKEPDNQDSKADSTLNPDGRTPEAGSPDSSFDASSAMVQDTGKKQVAPFFSSLGQMVSQWTASQIEKSGPESDWSDGTDSAAVLENREESPSLASSQASSQGEDENLPAEEQKPDAGLAEDPSLDEADRQDEAEPGLDETQAAAAGRARLYEHILDEEERMALFDSFRTSFYQVYEDYQNGQAEKWKDLRLMTAQKAGLADALDEEGFLPAQWFEAQKASEPKDSGLFADEDQDIQAEGSPADELEKRQEQLEEDQMEDDEPTGWPIPGYSQLLNPNLRQAGAPKKMMRKAAAPASSGALRVTKKELKNYISMFGGALTNSIWTLSNGCQAFCADGVKAAPPAGAIVKSIASSSNSALRKALYYGYQGPINLLASPANLNGAVYSQAQQIVITNDLVSEAHSGTCLSRRYALWSPGMENIYRLVLSQPEPPKEFKVYLCTFEGTGLNGLGDTVGFQPLAYGVMSTPEKADKGALQVLKTDANPAISNAGGSNYSLAGAQFELVKGASGPSGMFVRTLTIGRDEASEVVEVDPGIYWVRETKAPKGYVLNPQWHRIEVTADSSMEGPCRILVKNAPQYTTVDLLLRKINGFTGQPDARLAGAKFRICYFAIDPAQASRAASLSPSNSWIRQTDASGEIRVPGSKFPIGVITIQEIEAPEGFKKDETLYTIPLDPKGSSQEVFQAYNPPTIRERPAGIHLIKKDETGSLSLAGAVFKVTAPSGKSFSCTTDTNGTAFLELEENGTWQIEETRAPDGYSINPVKIVLRVSDTALECDAPGANGTIELAGQSLLVRDLPESYGIRLVKKNRKDQPLANAVFGLYKDAALSELAAKVATNEQGEAVFGNLAMGSSWFLAELEAPEGYQLPAMANGKPKVYMIRATARTGQDPFWSVNGKTVGSSVLDEAHGFARLEMENEKTAMIGLTVYNEQLPVLPDTGSIQSLLALGGGTLLAAGGMIFLFSKKGRSIRFKR